MATAAFKSTSKRGKASTSSDNSLKKAPLRRSLSLPRGPDPPLDINSVFSNKRDNPLFSSSGSPPDKEAEPESSVGLTKLAQNLNKVSASASTSRPASADARGERGRSVIRNSDVVNKKVAAVGRKESVGRSLSRLNTGRRGSSVFSRSHYAASEGDLDRDSVVSPNFRNNSSKNVAASSPKKASLGRSVAGSPRKSIDNRSIEPSDDSPVGSVENYDMISVPNWEDGISVCSLSEVEEKTIKAVCEQMKSFQGDQVGEGDNAPNGIYQTVRSEVQRAISNIQNDIESAIRRNNATAIAETNITDIPPDLVNPGAVELVLDIRRDYARKLEESEERARILRADLAVEEHRRQGLNRILNELLPDPKTTNKQKSRTQRKNSRERKKMSKRLTEEAMAYFDECVSISTFDGSDFSAAEDQPLSLNGAATPMGDTASVGQGSPGRSTSFFPNIRLKYSQESGGHGPVMHSPMGSGLTASSSCNEPLTNQPSLMGNNAEWGRKMQFSISQKPADNVGLQQEIKNYLQNVEQVFGKDAIKLENLRSNYSDMDEHLHGRGESCLFDRILYKNRIDSGSLHLCQGGLSILFSPFGPVI